MTTRRNPQLPPDGRRHRTIKLPNRDATERLGRAFAERATPGMVLALTGDPGAGKTTFTQAFARGLGITRPVASPTFVLLQEYPEGRLPLFHFDLYRLTDAANCAELGLDDYLFGDGVSVIEWADRIRGTLPPTSQWLNFHYGENEEERIVEWNEPAGD